LRSLPPTAAPAMLCGGTAPAGGSAASGPACMRSAAPGNESVVITVRTLAVPTVLRHRLCRRTLCSPISIQRIPPGPRELGPPFSEPSNEGMSESLYGNPRYAAGVLNSSAAWTRVVDERARRRGRRTRGTARRNPGGRGRLELLSTPRIWRLWGSGRRDHGYDGVAQRLRHAGNYGRSAAYTSHEPGAFQQPG